MSPWFKDHTGLPLQAIVTEDVHMRAILAIHMILEELGLLLDTIVVSSSSLTTTLRDKIITSVPLAIFCVGCLM